MIGIAAVFLFIGYMEWIYMRRDQPEGHTLWIVMGLDIFLMICAEAVYFAETRGLSVGMSISAVFASVQRLLFAGT